MINNRQNGRRRGRSGGAPRPNGTGGAPERGSRLDNRARGNATQLHEKYKTLARDAQMQGDRVMTEYYLQFADHYFRVLSETRSRFDEQQQRRDRFDGQGDLVGDEDEDADGEMNGDDRFDDRPGERAPQRGQEWGQERGNEGSPARGEGGRNEGRGDGNRESGRNDGNRGDGNRGENGRDVYRSDGNRAERQDRGDEPRDNRQPREQADARVPRVRRGFNERRDGEPGREQPEAAAPREERPRDDRRDERPRQPQATRAPAENAPTAPMAELPLDAVPERRPRGRPRKIVAPVADAGAERIEMDRLPPALSAEPAGEPGEDKPRRRVRRPRDEAAAADV